MFYNYRTAQYYSHEFLSASVVLYLRVSFTAPDPYEFVSTSPSGGICPLPFMSFSPIRSSVPTTELPLVMRTLSSSPVVSPLPDGIIPPDPYVASRRP
jgi:hypothetical protein